MTANELASFEVDIDGLRELQAGMEPWMIVKEVVVNVFDLEDATTAEVDLSYKRGKALFVVTDDGSGFERLRDAYTLYGWTPKRENPEVRGRFNLGDKYALSLASYGKVETTTGTVEWKNGKRYLYEDRKRGRGTVVILELDWTKEQTEKVEAKLRTLIPPYGQNYYLNGERIPHRQPIETIEATLATVLLKNGRMSRTARKTKILVYFPREGETAQLMEMGVPVCGIDLPWSVSVEQKIPLSPNRDSVQSAYLRDVAAEVLNRMVIHLSEEQMASKWVDIALADERATDKTVKLVKEIRYPKALLWAPDAQARERARERGFDIVHSRTIDKAVLERFKKIGMPTSYEKFGIPVAGDSDKPSQVEVPREKWTPEMKAFESFARVFGERLLGFAPGISMMKKVRWVKNDDAVARFGGQVLTLYVNKLDLGFFGAIESRQIGLLVHEFAHHNGESPDGPHGVNFKRNLERLTGKAVMLALREPKVFDYMRYKDAV